MKRIWSVVCAALIMLTMLPSIAVFAATYGDYEYTVLDDNTAQITAYYGSASNADIPSTVNGYTVTQIGEGVFQNRTDLQSVSFPDSVTAVLNDAFNGCTALRSVFLPDNLKTIGDQAFLECASIHRLSIPDGVTTIGDYAFYGCKALESLSLPSSLQKLAPHSFSYCMALQTLTIPQGVTSIGESAFFACTALQSVTIPQGVTSIGESAFSSCESLQSVTIPQSVKTIGAWAFSSCEALQNVTMSFGVESLGNSAFSKCKSLCEIVIPDSVTDMGTDVFKNCVSLRRAVLSNNVSGVPNGTFISNVNLQDVTLPDHGGIGSEAFWHCTSLKSITLPSDANIIGDYAFYNCTALESVSVPDTLAKIGHYAFNGCDALRAFYYGGKGYYKDNVNIGSFNDDLDRVVVYTYARYGVRYDDLLCVVQPDNTVRIQDCYGYNRDHSQICIPETVDGYPVTRIVDLGSVSFRQMINSVVLPKTLISIDDDVFRAAISLKHVFYGGTEEDRQRLDCGYNNSDLTKAEWHYDSVGGGQHYGLVYAIHPDDTASVVGFIKDTLLSHHVLPSAVNGYPLTSIGDAAFSGCSELSTVVVPDSVTSLGESAFEGCSSLQSLTLPRTLTDIRYRTFANCEALEHVVLPQGVTTIEQEAFDGCTALMTVALPASVQTIDAWAFADCDRLQTVYYGGTEDNRASMNVKDGNDSLQYAVWHYGCVRATKTYPDVKAGDWHYDAVNYVAANGYMTGFGNGNFGPAANMQRQDFVLILSRIAGADLTAYEGQNGGMTDVPKGAYYAAAVAWGVEHGIITGYQNGKFGVGDPITREQVCTILYRYMNSPVVENVDGTLEQFPDKATISAFAKTPVAWAVQNGVMSGMASGKMAPVAKASRAQVAIIVMRMDQANMFQ